LITVSVVVELQRLRSDHADAVLEFELINRAYFAAWVSDRGDAFYENFGDEHGLLLAEQAAGGCVFHVLVDDDRTVLGRFNLYDLEHETAVVGYRVAERVTGRGVATAALRELCELATGPYALRMLMAMASNENVSSQRVLEKAGFVATGPTDVAGRPGTRYERSLAD
jgi:ribosomal-protein-alanine N-acetyltransferase